jgi:alpha/beta superfamily hydrolase
VSVQALRIAGPAGALEAVFEQPRAAGVALAAGCAIICHPHPLQGGTLQNKVVHTLARSFLELGYMSLRFNFRGVGASAGAYGEGVGETADALAVAAWVRASYPDAALALAGFSFGGAVAFNAATRLSPQSLITIAPAVDRVAVADHARPKCPWLIVQGDADDVVLPAHVSTWAARFEPKPTLALLPGVGHFFHGALNQLQAEVLAFARQAPRSA